MEQPNSPNNINFKHSAEVLLFFSCQCYRQSKFMQRSFALASCLAILVFAHELFQHLAFEIAQFKTVYGIYGGSVLTPFATASICNIFAPRRIMQILDALHRIVSANELYLNVPNSEHTFNKTVNRTVILAGWSFSMVVALRWMERPFYSTDTLSILVLLLELYRHYLIVYMVYLIDLARHILGVSSVRGLEHSRARKLNEHQSIRALSTIRLIHLEICEVVKQINGHFGWVFIAIFFEAFINTARSIYKIIIYFYDSEGSRRLVLRKYYPLICIFYQQPIALVPCIIY